MPGDVLDGALGMLAVASGAPPELLVGAEACCTWLLGSKVRRHLDGASCVMGRSRAALAALLSLSLSAMLLPKVVWWSLVARAAVLVARPCWPSSGGGRGWGQLCPDLAVGFAGVGMMRRLEVLVGQIRVKTYLRLVARVIDDDALCTIPFLEESPR